LQSLRTVCSSLETPSPQKTHNLIQIVHFVMSLVSVDAVAAELTAHSSGSKHLLKVYLSRDGVPSLNISNGASFELQIMGDFWRFLPGTLSSIAPYLLPHNVTCESVSALDSATDDVLTSLRRSNNRWWRLVFNLNLPGQVRQSTISNFLGKLQIEHGNPQMLIDVSDSRYRFRVLVDAASLKSSYICPNGQARNAVISSKNVNWNDFERFRMSSGPFIRLLRFLRWVSLAIMFTAVCWFVLFQPTQVLEKFPPIWNHSSLKTLKEVIVNLPQLRSQAWDLGILDNKLRNLEDSKSQGYVDEIDDILKQAAAILQRTSITSEQLHVLRERIIENELNKGIVARVTGFFTFVRLIWLLSILGISISLGPAIAVLVAPLARILARAFMYLTNEILIPVALFLHRQGVFEVAAWLAVSTLYVEGFRFKDPDSGFFISLTAIALTPVCWAYSSLVNAGVALKIKKESLVQLISLWAIVTMIPAIITYESQLLAFLFVAAIYSFLGFSFICFGLCYAIGFESKNALHRIIVVSFLITNLFAVLKYVGIQDQYPIIRIFSNAIAVQGNLTLNLGLLIFASEFDRSARYNYYSRNALFIVNVVWSLFVSNVLVIRGAANTAATFLVFYLMEKSVEWSLKARVNEWIMMLVGSILLYQAAMFLSTHPGWVVSMFSFD
jgi:hypothetical protein